MWQFLNPMFLVAGAAAAIPLILHLMQRRRVVPLPFSTIRFLKLAQKRSSNRIRMENLLLWLLRTLLVMLLAMAFAMPILRTHAFGQFMGAAQRDIAIVWDASFSMGYQSSRRKVWQDSRDTVLELIDSLGPGDRLTLFIAADVTIPLIEQPSGDFDQARALVNARQIEPTGGQLAPALVEAVASLEESGRREREIYIITDGQESAWHDFKVAATEQKAPREDADGETNGSDDEPVTQRGSGAWDPERIDGQTQLFIALLGAEKPENTAPVGLEIQPPTLMADRPSRLTARIARTGPAQNVAVTLNLNGREVNRQSVFVPENGVAVVRFALPPLPAGLHEGWIETPPDGLNIDNRMFFLLHARDRLPVAVVGAPSDVFFLERALNPIAEQATINANVYRPTELPLGRLSRYSTIFLCNALPLNGQDVVALENYVRTGGLLALFPGDRAQPSDYEIFDILPAIPERINEIATQRRRRVLLLLEPADPLFTGMQLPPGTVPSITAQRELSLKNRHPDAVPLAGASKDFPFMLARNSGAGRVLLFSVSADRRWSNFPLSPYFLPFVHQIVRFGAGLGEDPLFLEPQRTLPLSDLLADFSEDAEIRDPDHNLLPTRTIHQEHRAVQIAEDVMQPGTYTWRNRGGQDFEPAFAINVPREESDLTRADNNDIPQWLGLQALHVARDRTELLRLVEEHRLGRPLGETLLWLALILAMTELFTANRLSRKTRPLTEQMRIESSGRIKRKA